MLSQRVVNSRRLVDVGAPEVSRSKPTPNDHDITNLEGFLKRIRGICWCLEKSCGVLILSAVCMEGCRAGGTWLGMVWPSERKKIPIEDIKIAKSKVQSSLPDTTLSPGFSLFIVIVFCACIHAIIPFTHFSLL
jgi:hypothetical protein